MYMNIKQLKLQPSVLKPSWSSRPKQYFLFHLSLKVVHKLKLIKTNISNHRFDPLFFKLLRDKRESLYFNFCHYYYYIADWKIISASSCRVLFQTIISVFKRNKNRFLTCSKKLVPVQQKEPQVLQTLQPSSQDTRNLLCLLLSASQVQSPNLSISCPPIHLGVHPFTNHHHHHTDQTKLINKAYTLRLFSAEMGMNL